MIENTKVIQTYISDTIFNSQYYLNSCFFKNNNNKLYELYILTKKYFLIPEESLILIVYNIFV